MSEDLAYSAATIPSLERNLVAHGRAHGGITGVYSMRSHFKLQGGDKENWENLSARNSASLDDQSAGKRVNCSADGSKRVKFAMMEDVSAQNIPSSSYDQRVYTILPCRIHTDRYSTSSHPLASNDAKKIKPAPEHSISSERKNTSAENLIASLFVPRHFLLISRTCMDETVSSLNAYYGEVIRLVPVCRGNDLLFVESALFKWNDYHFQAKLSKEIVQRRAAPLLPLISSTSVYYFNFGFAISFSSSVCFYQPSNLTNKHYRTLRNTRIV